MRSSKNRDAILECLTHTDSHPTAEWVYEQMKAEYPNISLGTVYRNLNQLREAGLVRTMGMVNGPEHFDAIVSPHSHAICSKCGEILDLDGQAAFDEMLRAAGKESGYEFLEVQFLGVCPKCRERAENPEDHVS